jgi:hypothetical protein
MNLDDLKDTLKSQLSQVWSRIEESSTYNLLKDRFENLASVQQKLVMVGGGALLALLLISVPYSYFSASSENIAAFEEKRALVRELLKVAREASEVPDIPTPPPGEVLRSDIDRQLKSANLLPEQIKSIQVITAQTNLIPSSLLDAGVQINLAKLNLRQIIDIGYGIQRVSKSVKMSDVHISANPEDAKYFDVEFRVVTLAVPQAHTETPDTSSGTGSIRKAPKGKL